MPRPRAEMVAGWASIGAGAVHGALVRDHAEEWWGYGLFFLLAGLVQLLLGLALLTRAVNPMDTGPSWRAVRRGLYVGGIVTNVALLVVYAVSRTVGVPFLGPEAGEVEAVAPIDLVAKALELLAIGAFLALLWGRSTPLAAPGTGPAGGKPL